MTTPSSPPISLKDVATELGISSVGLSLSDTRVRGLAGIPSGPISLHDLLGKSAYTPMSPNVASDGYEDGAGVGGFSPSVSPNGGVAPYSYSWTVVSTTGLYTYSLTSATSNPCSLSLSPSTPFVPGEVDLKCTVTDGHGNSVDSNVAAFVYQSP